MAIPYYSDFYMKDCGFCLKKTPDNLISRKFSLVTIKYSDNLVYYQKIEFLSLKFSGLRSPHSK